MNQLVLRALVRRNNRKHKFIFNDPSIKNSLITFILLVIFFTTNQASGQITQSFFHTQAQRGIIKSPSLGTYSPQSTGSLYVGNVSFDQTGRGYIVFDISAIPSNATVTAATLNLRPIADTGTTPSSTSTILFKNLANRPDNFNTVADFNFLNGISQFASVTATVNSPLIISTADLKTKVQNGLGEHFVYFGLVNASEAAKGISFSIANADLFLSVTHTVPVPAAPTNLQASNITTTGCTLTWSQPPGSVTGYKIYRNDVFLQNAATLSATIQNLTPNTTYSFKVSATNAGGESSKSSPVSVTTLPVAPVGATFNNPINIGNFNVCQSYSNTVYAFPELGYGNEYGNSTDDVFYRFNLTTAAKISLNNCKQDGVSGTVNLLDASGNAVPGGTLIYSCDVGYQLDYILQPGIYNVVSEGAEGPNGTIYLPMMLTAFPIFTTSPNVSITAGTSTTLQAFASGLTYTWSPATGLSSTTGASVVASPGVTTTYNVWGTSPNGCADVKSITVNVTGAVGSTFSNPIVANIGGCGYSSVMDPAAYGNDYGGPTNDIFYKFTLASASEVSIHGYSMVDLHLVLLNSSGNFVDEQYYSWIEAGDDGTIFVLTDGTPLKPTLQPGTYYVVAEGTNVNGPFSVGIETPAGYGCRKASPSFKGSLPPATQASDTTTVKTVDTAISTEPEDDDLLTAGMYPNPTKDYVTFSLTHDGPATVHFVSASGIDVKQASIVGQSTKVSINDLPEGLYFVKIIQQNKVRSEKMLIER